VLEPGSTIKPFTIAAALESGKFVAADIIDTSPGRFNVGRYVVRDFKNFGELSLSGVLKNSSNIGAGKIALQLDRETLWNAFDRLGFGQPPLIEFPGAVAGSLPHHSRWSVVRQATVSYGYGMSTTTLQLARAYAALAADGLMPEVTFQKLNGEPRVTRVFSESITRDLRRMMQSVVSSGTGKAAAIPGYTVAGKTGTTHISENGSYADDRYLSLFAGMVPAENPSMVAVIVIKEPRGRYYGGEVAAPVFSKIMAGALRIRNVNPDGQQVYARSSQ
jgi:cell division protein FtsI (penicillin-binding protein 3)